MLFKSLQKSVVNFSKLNQQKFSTLVLGESKNGVLSKSTYKIIAAANQLQQDTHLFISGKGVSSAISQIQDTVSSQYIKKIIIADSDALQGNVADQLDQVLTKVVKDNGYKQVVSDASSFGKDILPRVASHFNSQPLTDIISIIDAKTFKRPIYAGNGIATVESTDDIKFLSFRPTAFEGIPQDSVQKIEEVEQLNVDVQQSANSAKFVSEEIVQSDRPELSSAKIVISGGRGLKNGENFAMLEELADTLGNAAIGASRAAVDAGYVSNDLQVGQTGKVVAPELYIAVGISGAIQHVAGMKDSKTIVAINKDEEAPIFEIATYGLVGDLFKIIPELNQKLQAAK